MGVLAVGVGGVLAEPGAWCIDLVRYLTKYFVM
jgi:hypothetical protein